MKNHSSLVVVILQILFCLPAIRAEWVVKATGEITLKNLINVKGVLISGNAAHSATSHDFGVTWQEAGGQMPEDGHPRDYLVTDGNTVFGMFHGFSYDACYSSDDYGVTWKQLLKTDSDELGRMWGIKGQLIINDEKYTGYRISTDGGKSFIYMKGCLIDGKETKSEFRSLAGTPDQVFVSRSKGRIIVSTDQMKTFKTLQSGPSGAEMGLVQAGKYLVVGGGGFDGRSNYFRLHVTADGGKTWIQSKIPGVEDSSFLHSAVEFNGEMLVSLRDRLVASSDGGKTWRDISDNLGPYQIQSESIFVVVEGQLGLQANGRFWVRR